MFKKKPKGIVDVGRFVMLSNKVKAEGNVSIDHFSILEGGSIKIGMYSTISSHCVLRGPIEVGRYTQLGPNVSVFSRNHPVESFSINVSRNFMRGKRKSLQKDLQRKVIIGSDVWIGAGVVILPGSIIGNGAVIAAESVVRGVVNDFEIVGGIPAKKIKMRYEQGIIDALNDLKWWEKDEEFVVKNKQLFMSKRISIEQLKSVIN